MCPTYPVLLVSKTSSDILTVFQFMVSSLLPLERPGAREDQLVNLK
jgi:hypothetical protein